MAGRYLRPFGDPGAGALVGAAAGHRRMRYRSAAQTIRATYHGSEMMAVGAQNMPHHAANGRSPEGMPGVAAACDEPGTTTQGPGGVIGYTLIGDLNGPNERGPCDLPCAVIFVHRQLASRVLGQ